MASSSLGPGHPCNSQQNHKSALQKALSASKGSTRLEDENMGNKSSLEFHALDYDCAHPPVERIHWDLNVTMEQWDVVVSSELSMDTKLSCGVMHEQKTEGCFGSDQTLRTSILRKSRWSPPLRNLRSATDSERDYESSLELQLRPPCSPELRIRWGNKSPPHLSLGLPGTHSMASCSLVKSESSKCSKGIETETAHCDISKSVDNGDVKSEECDGSFQVETYKEFVGYSDLNSHPLTSCCNKSTPGKVIPLVPNEEATPAVDMLPNYDSTLPGDAKIVQDKIFVHQSCAVVAEESKPGGPELHCVTKNSCEHEEKGMLGMSERSADMECSDNEYYSSREIAVGDIRADYVGTSAPQVASSTGNEHPQGAPEGPSGNQHKISVDRCDPVDDEEGKPGDPELCRVTEKPCNPEQKRMHGMSEGSAEMDCSDDECYTSQLVVVAGNIRVNHANNSGSCFPNLIGNKQPQSALEGPSGVQYKISLSQSSYIDGRPGDHEPCLITKKSCEHNKGGIHDNVATDAIGLDDQPTTGLHRVKKDNLMVLEEVRIGQIADNFDNNACLDKKETSCKTTRLSASRMEGASSRKKLTKPSQETSKKLPRKKISNLESQFMKQQLAIAKSETSAVIPPLNIRDSDTSINHSKPLDRGFRVNDLKTKKTRDKVQQQSDQTNNTLTSTSSGLSARSVRTGYEQGHRDYPRKRDWYFREKRHPNYYARINYDKHAPNYVHCRRSRKPHFHRSAHHRTEADYSRRHYVPRHYREFQIPPNMQLMNDQPNRPSRFLPNRQLPDIPPDIPMCTSSNGWVIGREVHTNHQLDHDEMMVVDNSMFQHSGVPPPAFKVDCYREDVIVAGNGRPPYSHLPTEHNIQNHPLNDLESRRPGAFLEGNAGPAEHLGPAYYVEHLQDIHLYAADLGNGVYRPDHFRTDGEGFPCRDSYRPYTHNNF